MGKIKVLAILEVEEDFIEDDSKSQYFQVENADINIGQDMVLSFPDLSHTFQKFITFANNHESETIYVSNF